VASNLNPSIGRGGTNDLAATLPDAFSPEHWLSIFRGQSRTILSKNILDPINNVDDLAILKDMDDELFGTQKYSGTSEYLTVITYSEGNNGAISLFKTSLNSVTNTAVRMELIASMTEVPRNILRQMKEQVSPNRIDLRFKGSRLRCRENGQQTIPWPTVVKTETNQEWHESGWGWRRALRLSENVSESEHQGLTATIPQMMAFLHLKQRYITNVHSTDILSFGDSLKLQGKNSTKVVKEVRGD